MRVGLSVWHARRIKEPNATVPQYEKPTEIKTRFNYFTVMPASTRGFLQVMKYGEDIDKTWTVVANYNAFEGKIAEGDLFWIDGTKPITKIESTYGNGASANAVVKNVSYVNHTISITLSLNKAMVVE